MHRINNLYNTRWGNIKLLLHQLPRSGWRVTTNTYMDRYKPAAIPNPYIVGVLARSRLQYMT